MTQLQVVIVDDEALARRGLKYHLSDIKGVQVVAEFGDPDQALAYLKNNPADLIFLDIEMPGLSGLALANALTDPLPAIVFVTAFDHYAVDAFSLQAFDYLLKPVDVERLQAVIMRMLARQDRKELEVENSTLRAALAAANLDQLAGKSEFKQILAIKDRGQTIRIEVAAIDWVEAAGDYMCVHADGETHVLRSTMQRLAAQLDPRQFIRVHRSALVNVAVIKAITSFANGEYRLTFSTGDIVKTSRRYKQAVRALKQSQ